MEKKTKKGLLIAAIILAVIALAGGGLFYLYSTSNPSNAATIGELPLPVGYERVPAEKGSYAEYLRSLPLKPRGAKVYLHNSDRLARMQWLSAAVVDMPTLSNDEQCADVCMRLRAEYLYSAGKYNQICFTNVNGKKMQYTGGKNRNAFEKYMRNVYGYCNTNSLVSSLPGRDFKDIHIGDVFVYGHRKVAGKNRYGHAVMVADMAVNKLTGKKIFIIVEGNTPARNIHVLRTQNPFRNPWFTMRENASSIQLLCFHFKNDQLRHF
ncbi:MAG: DUF4846 domain-containing protein [Paludibacteraceae bacterium]|nr:DUF4846 domain-containing protein [Paludibacteraceae bacterium]